MSEAIDGEQDEPVHVRLNKLEAKVEQVLKPVAVDEVPQLQERITEQATLIDELRNEIARLESKLDRRIGVATTDASTHEKRVQDTAEILIRRAEAGSRRLSMYAGEITASLVEHNHPELAHQQATRIMDDLSERDGFTLATGQRDVATTDDRSDVREVQVIQCDLDRVPGSDPTNNVVGGEGDDAVDQTASSSRSTQSREK